MTTRPQLLTLALCAAVVLPGCANRSASLSPFSAALAERNEIRVDVLNNNFSDATLWAIIENARRVRLGNVTGKTDAVFTMPWDWTNQNLKIEIDLVAGPRCVTRAIPVDPGDILQLEIKPTFLQTAGCTPI